MQQWKSNIISHLELGNGSNSSINRFLSVVWYWVGSVEHVSTAFFRQKAPSKHSQNDTRANWNGKYASEYASNQSIFITSFDNFWLVDKDRWQL